MRRDELGFTQIELMVGVTIMLIVTGGIIALASTGVDTYRIGATRVDVEQQASRVLDRVVEELATTGQEVLTPVATAPVASSQMDFQRNLGWTGSAIIWGPPTSIRLVDDPNDPDDGVDNNTNGLVDEKMLVLREKMGTPDERTIVLCRFVRKYLEGETGNGKDDNGNGLVDEPGFSLSVNGNLWTVRLTIERPDAKGRLLTYTARTAARPRN